MRRAWRWYQLQLETHPVKTQSIVSGVLWGSGDIIAQKITSYTTEKNSGLKYDMDWKRTAVCSLFGLGFIGPFGNAWYKGLDTFVKNRLMLQPNSAKFIVAKLIPDTIFAPVHLAVFFSLLGFSEGKSREEVVQSVKRDFPPAFISEAAVWPALQALNFRFVPVAHQLLFLNTLGLADSAFLSWINKQEDAPWKQRLLSYLRQ